VVIAAASEQTVVDAYKLSTVALSVAKKVARPLSSAAAPPVLVMARTPAGEASVAFLCLEASSSYNEYPPAALS